jgi:hypothetical protein
MFAQIEISVLESTQNTETLDVKISKNGTRLEASMILSGPFNLCARGLIPKETSVEGVLEAVRSTLLAGDHILTRHLLDFAHNIHAPVVVRVHQG